MSGFYFKINKLTTVCRAITHLHWMRPQASLKPIDSIIPSIYTVPESLHAAKILGAAKACINLFALPSTSKLHSPLLTCILAYAPRAYLAICSQFPEENSHQVARNLVGVSINTFKLYEKLFPVSSLALAKLKPIAREYFERECKEGEHPTSLGKQLDPLFNVTPFEDVFGELERVKLSWAWLEDIVLQ
jgi:hypothetical protein